MNKICLFGASGHGKVIKEIIESQKNSVIAFFDDAPKSATILNIPVFSNKKVNEFESEKFIISIGNNEIRKRISQSYRVKYSTAIHSTAILSKSSKIEEGTVVMAGAVINSETIIGKHCIINSNTVVEHDCRIDDFVHISPNATVTGGSQIGEGTHVGAGVTIIPNIKIGKWATIGAGTVVLKDVPDYAVIVGNPGKVIKYNN